MKTTKKKKTEEMTHHDCLVLVQRMIEAIHGVKLSIPQIGKRWRDVTEGVPVTDIIKENSDANI